VKLPIVCSNAQIALLLLIFAATRLPAQTVPQIASLQIPNNRAALDLPDAPSAQVAQQQCSSNQQQASRQDVREDEKEKKKLEHEEAEKVLNAEEHQRIAGVLPNFNTVIGGYAPPLSVGQKMRVSFRSAIDPAQFAIAGLSAAYGQATDSHSSIDSTGFRHGYPQGMVGYAKRYGAAYADQFDGTILGNGLFPALLHQDPRYFRLGSGTIKHRILYAALTTIRCKGDNGKWQPNVSNLLGNLAAGGVSNLYYPAAERGFDLTIEQGLLVTAEGTFGSFLLEFYPDVQKRLSNRHKAGKSKS
jgi:hypothetical protein